MRRGLDRIQQPTAAREGAPHQDAAHSSAWPLGARVRQAAAFAALGLVAYLSLATSCASEPWNASVERSVDLAAQEQATLRLDLHVDGRPNTVRIHAQPGVTISGVVFVEVVGDAGTAGTAGTAATASASASASLSATATASTVNELAPAGSTVSSDFSQIVTLPDGSVTVTCGTHACERLEFVVSRSSTASAGQVRVFADVEGGSVSCSAERPSFLEVSLTEVTPVMTTL
jgi:hypothetical protein